MISTAVKVLRVCGQNLDVLGRMLESSTHVDKRLYLKLTILRRCYFMGVVYDFKAVDLYLSASYHSASFVTLHYLTYFIMPFHAVQPSLRAAKLGGKLPVINGAFVAPTATILGKVHVGSSSSIWYSAVIRGNTRISPRWRLWTR
jgi:hypothetical protein